MQQQSFPIDNYFMYLAERYLDRADVLLQEEAISLCSVQKGYHLFEVQDDKLFEVEVLVGRKKVTSFSCDCPHFLTHQICAHIAAGIKIIVHKRDQQNRRQKQKKHPSSVGTLHVNKLLAHLEIQDLRAFVRKYAAHDTAFSLKLKAQFAHLVEVKNNDTKYFEILKRNEKHIVKSKINRPKFRKIEAFLIDLLALADDLSVQKNYKEAYGILYGSLSYLISRRAFFRPFEDQSIHLQTHQKFRDFLAADIAPDLLKKAFQQGRQLYLENDYYVEDSLLNLYYIFFKAFGPAQQALILEDLGSTRLEHLQSDQMTTLTLLRIHMEAGDGQGIQQLILQEEHQKEHLSEIFEILLGHDDPLRPNHSQGQKNAYKKMAHEILLQLYDKATVRQQRMAILQILEQADASEGMLHKLYLDCFIKDTEHQMLSKLRQMDRWGSTKKVIINHLKENSLDKLLANLYRIEGMDADLIEMLEAQKTLPQLLEHAQYLHDHNAEWLHDQILIKMKEHLDKHLGYQSITYVDQVLRTLEKFHLRKLARQIKHELIQLYPERSFFTKALKQA